MKECAWAPNQDSSEMTTTPEKVKTGGVPNGLIGPASNIIVEINGKGCEAMLDSGS